MGNNRLLALEIQNRIIGKINRIIGAPYEKSAASSGRSLPRPANSISSAHAHYMQSCSRYW